jgi:hypothetical protein
LLHVRIQVSKSHRLSGISIQLRVTPECLDHPVIILESHRRQRAQQPRGEAGALFLRQVQGRSRDLINAPTNPILVLELWPVDWLAASLPVARCCY